MWFGVIPAPTTGADQSRHSRSLRGAAGMVTGEASGLRLTLRYRIKGPLVMRQTLTLAADSKSIENVGRITVFGIPIGSLHELIRRND
jgi:Na+(H+)/acetate symporter ActP